MTLFLTITLVASKNVLTAAVHAAYAGVNKERPPCVSFIWIPHLLQNTRQCYRTPVYMIATAGIHLPKHIYIDEFLTVYFKIVYNFNVHSSVNWGTDFFSEEFSFKLLILATSFSSQA